MHDLIAYKVSSIDNWTIEPAQGRRAWMDATQDKFAYRCLPLVMANQAGWVIGCPLNFTATWNGGQAMDSIKLHFPDGQGNNFNQIRSHFGNGVLTFSMPWIFRTPKGIGLWVRGPANDVRDGIVALDGVVETDWAPYSFTMNWKLTRPSKEIVFSRGDPVCMIVPFPLDLLEGFAPAIKEIDADPVLKGDFEAFRTARSANIEKIARERQSNWQMDYMRGHMPDGTPVTEHRKAFKLQPFREA